MPCVPREPGSGSLACWSFVCVVFRGSGSWSCICRAAGSAICLDDFERVEHWDCGGQDIESVAVEWSDHGDLERCAARCMELGDECVGFNFGSPGSERGDNEPCYMKRDFAPAPACGAASSGKPPSKNCKSLLAALNQYSNLRSP